MKIVLLVLSKTYRSTYNLSVYLEVGNWEVDYYIFFKL